MPYMWHISLVMKPYMNPKGKGLWAYTWGDKVKRKIKRIFKKSARQIHIKDKHWIY